MGGATAVYCSDHPSLDGNSNIMSCWDGSTHHSSAFAKLLWEVVFLTPVRETLVLKIDNMKLVTSTVCMMPLFKNKTNAFSGLFFVWIVDPSGLTSDGSSLKLKADPETGTVKTFSSCSWHHI